MELGSRGSRVTGVIEKAPKTWKKASPCSEGFPSVSMAPCRGAFSRTIAGGESIVRTGLSPRGFDHIEFGGKKGREVYKE